MPISLEYNNFRKSPSGVVEKYTKISSYRVDLTNSIDRGESWQLGFLVAHLINHFGNLNFSKTEELIPNATENILWCSGIVNANLDLDDVTYIKTKLLNSKQIFEESIKQKQLINLCVSNGKEKEVEEYISSYDSSLKKS